MDWLRTLTAPIRHSVRRKLLALVLLPLGLVLPIALAGLIVWGASFTYDQLYIKVHTDLAVAHDTFERMKRDVLDHLVRLSDSYRFRQAAVAKDDPAMLRLIADLKHQAGFSFVRVLRPPGVADLPRQASVGIEILGPEELAAIDPAIARFVRLPIVETKRARPSVRAQEDRGMIIRAYQPVYDNAGQLLGVLDGGVLLNNNFAFVDAIRDLVYGPGSLPEGSIGTVTVFLDDVRISTNVPRVAGRRALGTRVSEEVVQAVLDAGSTWIDRAFVVNDWYISAYEPIVDVAGERVGMLYAGYLETPYRTALWQALGLTVLILVAMLALYALLAIGAAKTIFHPVEKMSEVVHATRLGDSARVGKVSSEDELAGLAREFDAMLDRLEQQNSELQRWAAQLEEKVADRTAELQLRNAELQRTIVVLRDTRRKLVTAEKLAALGELTAGVAHEINNPTQVMLGNLDVLIAELGDRLDPVRPEIDLVIEQIYRIQGIVDKLLKYARPADYAGYLTETNVNRLIQDTVALVAHLRRRRPFHLVLELHATRTITINGQELQQVLVNLLSNAVHALPDIGGEIVVRSYDWENRGVCISVGDNGAGMDADQCSQVFNPFYSTKREGEGTGLGLSVSYGLIRRYGGDITVDSEPGVGSTFRIRLLSEPRLIDDAEEFEAQLYDSEQPGPAESSGARLP